TDALPCRPPGDDALLAEWVHRHVGPPSGGTMSRSTARSALVLALLAGSLAACADEGTPAATAPTTSAAASSAPATTTPAPEETTPEPTAAEPATNGTTVLTSPLDGAVVTGPTVTIAGEATAFEGNLSWVVYPAD